jgi:uncharacterized GH25 family protein
VTRFAKALVVVGAARPGERIWRSELGHRLELLPLTDPVPLADAGGTLAIQVLLDREPLAGAELVAVLLDGREVAPRRATTGGNGHARFALDRPGRWRVGLSHRTRSGRLESSLVLIAGPND